MKKLLLIAALASTSAFAYTDKEVGYCGSYHLLLKHYDNVSDIAKKAKHTETMQSHARAFIAIAGRSAADAVTIGRASCKAIGYAQN
jgi:hypothetical protein